MSNVIAFNQSWCQELPKRLKSKTRKKFHIINHKEKMNKSYLDSINVENIFFPHWSYIIPEKIYTNYRCIIFHMTDLPYGRGGSPLQNLIVRGHKETIISAIQCVKELDAGPIYLKKPLSLKGSAEEIFMRASRVVEKMIIEILDTDPTPVPQKGEVVNFKRRTPEEGDWSKVQSLDMVFDYIRMLDAESYPPAFINIDKYKLEFTGASQKVDAVYATVKITKKGNTDG